MNPIKNLPYPVKFLKKNPKFQFMIKFSNIKENYRLPSKLNPPIPLC